MSDALSGHPDMPGGEGELGKDTKKLRTASSAEGAVRRFFYMPDREYRPNGPREAPGGERKIGREGERGDGRVI